MSSLADRPLRLGVGPILDGSGGTDRRRLLGCANVHGERKEAMLTNSVANLRRAVEAVS
jgi:hypothetical protein